jgi:hypothetical protein
MFLCCALCCACRLDSKGSNLGSHTCKTHANLHTGTQVAHHARLVPTLGAPRVGTNVAPHAKPMPTLDLARMLQHKQNTCQLWTCKSRANSYPQVIHRLPHAILVPLLMLAQMLHTSNTRATSNVGTDVATQEACQLLDKCWTNVGPGRGLTCVDNCSSHSGTKKVKTRKKEP